MSGRILVGDHGGVYVLRFEGDVRVTLSGSFDHYMQKMLVDGSLDSVLVDLTDAVAIDSTSLGVLAKLSIQLQKERARLPTLVCQSPDILRVLNNMGFDDVFAIVDENFHRDQNLAELPMANDMSEETLRGRVIEAHKVLMAMNTQNEKTFKDLVEALETEQTSARAS
ncbi:MAG: STAS domain-containing protein [Pseudomonadales bacterium]|nr:STAS domain-containing protein [Pseudomonadales bacterium]